MDSDRLNIHAVLPFSRANGPGLRTVIWLQGCTLGCPGCFNPDTHDSAPRQLLTVEELLEQIQAREDRIEGVTFSGGEPLQQAAPLQKLLQMIRGRTGLSVALFSGFTRSEIERMPLGPAILAHLDVLIDGRYREEQRLAKGLRGSANQQIHLLTNRYRPQDFESLPAMEVIIDQNGDVVVTGLNSLY